MIIKNYFLLLTHKGIYDKFKNGSAAVAQEVAHLIGSEEVTGSTPVSSFRRKRLRHQEGCFSLFLLKVFVLSRERYK